MPPPTITMAFSYSTPSMFSCWFWSWSVRVLWKNQSAGKEDGPSGQLSHKVPTSVLNENFAWNGVSFFREDKALWHTHGGFHQSFWNGVFREIRGLWSTLWNSTSWMFQFSWNSSTRARPGFEPGTSRTLSENHTPRPTSHVSQSRQMSITQKNFCFRPGSNRRPCACEAHVITTTLRKPYEIVSCHQF